MKENIGAAPAVRRSAAQELGRRGEAHAAGFYRDRGGQVIAANVRYAVGEIDLIVREADGTIVFAEVKTRSGLGFGAAEAVSARKLRRMRRAAAQWLKGQATAFPLVRFDVVVIVRAQGQIALDYYPGVDSGSRH